MNIRKNISQIILNLSPKRVRDKILVIESDDWGAIRSPRASEENKGYKHDGPYRLDTLENENDIEVLVNALSGVKNREGFSPVFTANFLLTNPNFSQIKENGFEEYFWEPIHYSYGRVGNANKVKALFDEAINNGHFSPQLHGREHVNICRWLNALKKSHQGTLESFEYGSTYSGKDDYSYMESFDFDEDDIDPIKNYKEILSQAVNQFKSYFGQVPESFIPPCYTFPRELFSVLRKLNVKSIQGMKYLIIPKGGISNYGYKRRYQGVKSDGLINLVRNVELEPSIDNKKDWIGNALHQTMIAFMMKQPAIVSTHRINYVGGVSIGNRDRGIEVLTTYLEKVLKRWPEVKFMSSAELTKNYYE
jgi:hypothetical protein